MIAMEKRRGTIAKVLNDHKEELFDLLNKGKVWECRKRAISLLDDDSLKNNSAVPKAKLVFESQNDNLFMSCLVTYMSGMKVS